MDKKTGDKKTRRDFLKKAWAVPTLFALGHMEAVAKQGQTLSELCAQTGQNSIFCKCLKNPNSNPACKKFF